MNTTHSKSCNVDAFSYITGIPVDTFIEEIGHDGTENGFTTQEVIDVLVKNGFSVTMIEKAPQAIDPRTGETRWVYGLKEAVNRWKNYLSTSRGVLHGAKEPFNFAHAVAWDGFKEGLIGQDPAKFDPYILWKVEKIVQAD